MCFPPWGIEGAVGVGLTSGKLFFKFLEFDIANPKICFIFAAHNVPPVNFLTGQA